MICYPALIAVISAGSSKPNQRLAMQDQIAELKRQLEEERQAREEAERRLQHNNNCGI